MTIKAIFKNLYFKIVVLFRRRKHTHGKEPEITCYAVMPVEEFPEKKESNEHESPSQPKQD